MRADCGNALSLCVGVAMTVTTRNVAETYLRQFSFSRIRFLPAGSKPVGSKYKVSQAYLVLFILREHTIRAFVRSESCTCTPVYVHCDQCLFSQLTS